MEHVAYVPDKCHAFDWDHETKKYAWKFTQTVGDRTNDIADAKILDAIKGQGKEFKKTLNPIGPQTAWPAQIVNLNADGTADLDIESHNRGCTLHYKNVREDPTGKTPHTFHRLAE